MLLGILRLEHTRNMQQLSLTDFLSRDIIGSARRNLWNAHPDSNHEKHKRRGGGPKESDFVLSQILHLKLLHTESLRHTIDKLLHVVHEQAHNVGLERQDGHIGVNTDHREYRQHGAPDTESRRSHWHWTLRLAQIVFVDKQLDKVVDHTEQRHQWEHHNEQSDIAVQHDHLRCVIQHIRRPRQPRLLHNVFDVLRLQLRLFRCVCFLHVFLLLVVVYMHIAAGSADGIGDEFRFFVAFVLAFVFASVFCRRTTVFEIQCDFRTTHWEEYLQCVLIDNRH
mmetsp:Transcript_71938/g.114578  ORF Transcript_71938/g.114578 Transcript_71938/m.114578 type:complete len:280 (+) Transcript_71938:119-958(+)